MLLKFPQLFPRREQHCHISPHQKTKILFYRRDDAHSSQWICANNRFLAELISSFMNCKVAQLHLMDLADLLVLKWCHFKDTTLPLFQ